jgi:guanosine-3',5'-bis(diphosphate) 3'-pyrophosphohydrolase
MDLFTKSLVFAAEKHQSQRRKQAGDIPYINHPLEVSHILSLAGVRDY